MTKSLHVIFHGRVQGVGFRWTVRDHAENLHLTGYVKNCPNGTVEALLQGPKKKLEAFFQNLEADKGKGFARIDKIEREYLTPIEKYKGFQILF